MPITPKSAHAHIFACLIAHRVVTQHAEVSTEWPMGTWSSRAASLCLEMGSITAAAAAATMAVATIQTTTTKTTIGLGCCLVGATAAAGAPAAASTVVSTAVSAAHLARSASTAAGAEVGA